MLGIDESVFLQLLNGALSLLGDVAERISGIDTDDGQAESVNGMELHLRLDEYFHAGLELLSGLGLEIGIEHLLRTRPAGGTHLGCLAVYKFEVHMSAFEAEAADLRLHPIRGRQTVVQRLADKQT